jgi:hypothetical protein
VVQVESGCLNLTAEQEKRLKAGDYRPLAFPLKQYPVEPVEPNFRLILDWDEGYRTTDPLGNVSVIPPQPVRWIVVTSVKRAIKSDHWLVRFDATDQRQELRWMARGGGYTTSRFRSIDDLETVPAKDQQRMADAASKRDHLVRLEAVAARRTDQWRMSRERRKAIATLRSAA